MPAEETDVFLKSLEHHASAARARSGILDLDEDMLGAGRVALEELDVLGERHGVFLSVLGLGTFELGRLFLIENFFYP